MKNDIRFAFRMIASHAWFSTAIVVTLALGIGINTTVFTLVNAVLFKPVALPGGDRLMVVNSQKLTEANSRFGVSYADFLEFKANNRSFEGLEATSRNQAIISETSNPPGRFSMARISWALFDMVRTPPVLGRGFTSSDDKPGAAAAAIIGYRVWETRYGKAPGVIGRVVRLNGQPVTIVGVMPEGFKFPSGQDIWTPLVPTENLQKRSNRPLQLFGVLRPGVTQVQAGADLALIAKRLAGAFADTNKDTGATVMTFHEAFNGGNIRTMFLLMMGAVGFVLLIACANVANMMLSRALARKREISVRAAMGASRWQIVRQLLIESVMLSVLGGVLGLGLSLTGVHYFDLATVEPRPYWIQFKMDWVVFGYFAAISVLSGLLFGLVPALRASRVDLNIELKEGTRTAGNVRGGWLSGALVVLQFSLTVVLLSGAGLMVRSFFGAQSINDFVPAEQVFTARVSLPGGKGEPYADRAARIRFFDRLRPRLAGLPGVTHSAVSSNLPGLGSDDRRIEIEGKPTDTAAKALRAEVVIHSPGFQELTGLAIQGGRGFNEQDGDPGREAAIATRTFAARHWPNQSAVGKRFRFVDDEKPGLWIAVVGVTGDILQRAQNPQDVHPLVFIPHRQEGWGTMNLLLRTRSNAASLSRPLQSLVQQIDQDLPLFDVSTLPEALGKQRWMIAVFGALFFSFACIGLLIASVGIYAVVAQATTRRTREIGIRMALGATAQNILGIMLARGAWQLGLGLVIGLAGALAATRLMKGLLIGVSPQDPVVFVGVSALLIAIGLFACWLPARRAAALHPVQALREE